VPEDPVAGTGGLSAPATPAAPPSRAVTPAVAGALVLLAASFALSVAFVLANGGLDLPMTAQGPSISTTPAAGGATSGGSAAPSVVPSVVPTVAPSVAPGAAPSVAPTPGPPATSAPTSAPGPRPSSDRYELLIACPDIADCWVYVVRQGDNLFSIAKYFGVPLTTIEERNAWTRTTQLVAGQELILPTPTR
jgi:hypothetical protein